MLQIRSERFLVICIRDEEVDAGPVIDVLQKGDEGLALSASLLPQEKPVSVAANKMQMALRTARLRTDITGETPALCDAAR